MNATNTTYNPFRAANAATAYDFACSMADRLYWLDDNYIQPFYVWVAPQLREVAISGLYWGLITFIDISLWLIDTTRQFMARDAHAIALNAFAQAHAPFRISSAGSRCCPAGLALDGAANYSIALDDTTDCSRF
jgi:hypothetical protein